MVGIPGYRTKRLQNLVVTRADALAITKALRAAFPSLRITLSNLSESYYDEQRYYERCHEWHERGGVRSGVPKPEREVRDPRGEPFPYFASFAVPEQDDFTAWIEPLGWQPRWTEGKDKWGFYRLLNRPLLEFRFLRSQFDAKGERGPGNHLFADAPEPLDPEEIIYLTGGQVCAHWPKENSPAKAFFEKVFRIVARLTTDSFISVGPNLKARGAEPFRSGGYYYRAGRDACAWTLQRRHNYFQDRWKPGNYPFKPDEIYTPQELAAERARNEALWAEMKAKTEAEIEANRLRRPRAKRA